jgi:hypothetical protein
MILLLKLLGAAAALYFAYAVGRHEQFGIGCFVCQRKTER